MLCKEMLLIPIQEIAKIHDLHAAVLRRAAAVGFDALPAEIVLQILVRTLSHSWPKMQSPPSPI